MIEEQSKVLERDILYVKTPVAGTNIDNRINRLGDTANYITFNMLKKCWQEGELCR